MANSDSREIPAGERLELRGSGRGFGAAEMKAELHVSFDGLVQTQGKLYTLFI